jgi:hypothetical protein
MASKRYFLADSGLKSGTQSPAVIWLRDKSTQIADAAGVGPALSPHRPAARLTYRGLNFAAKPPSS